MVEIIGVDTTVHFSPKDLGLNAGFSGLFFNNSELHFQNCFRTVRTEFMDYFRAVRS